MADDLGINSRINGFVPIPENMPPAAGSGGLTDAEFEELRYPTIIGVQFELLDRIFVEKDALEKKPNPDRIRYITKKLEDIIKEQAKPIPRGEETVHKLHFQVFLSLCYALVNLQIMSGDYSRGEQQKNYYEQAKNNLANLNYNPNNSPLFGTNSVYNNSELRFSNHQPDKQNWFVSMAIQLMERGAIVSNEDAVIKFLEAVPAENRVYKNAAAYIKLRLNPSLKGYEDLCAAVRNSRTPGSTAFLLRLQILNSFLSSRCAANMPAAIRADIAAVEAMVGSDGIFLPPASDLKVKHDNPDLQLRMRMLAQVRTDTYVQYYMLHVSDLKLSAQQARDNGDYNLAGQKTAELSRFIARNANPTSRLIAEQGAYFEKFIGNAEREISFLTREMIVNKMKNAIPLAAGEQLGSPQLTPLNNSERQRLYYIEAEEALLRKDTEMFLARTVGSPVRGMQGVLDNKFDLDSGYVTGERVYDEALLLNARCGAAEQYLQLKQLDKAQAIYNKLKESVLSGRNINAYLQDNNLDTRFLFIAGQLENDRATKLAIFRKIYSATPAIAETRMNGQLYAYTKPGVRDHWTAAAFLAFLGDNASIREIENEYNKRLTAAQDSDFIKGLYADISYIILLGKLDGLKSSGQWQAGLNELNASAALFTSADQVENAARQKEKLFQQYELENIRYVYGGGIKPNISALERAFSARAAEDNQRLYYLSAAQLAHEKNYAAALQEIVRIGRLQFTNGALSYELLNTYKRTADDNDKTAAQYNQEFTEALLCAYLEILDWYKTKQQKPPIATYPEDLAQVFKASFASGPGDPVSRIRAKTENWTDSELRIMFLAAKYVDNNIYAEIKNRPQYAKPVAQSGGYRYSSTARRAYWEALQGQFYLSVQRKDEQEMSRLYAELDGEIRNNPAVADVNYAQNMRREFDYNRLLFSLEADKQKGDWVSGLEKLSRNAAMFTATDSDENAKRQRELLFQQAEFETQRYVYGGGAKPDISRLTARETVMAPQDRQRLEYLKTAQLAKDAADRAAYLAVVQKFVSARGDRLTVNLSKEYLIEEDAEKNKEFRQAMLCAYLEILDQYAAENITPPRGAYPADLARAFFTSELSNEANRIYGKQEPWTDGELRIMFLAAKYNPAQQEVYYQKIQEKYPPQTGVYNSAARRAYWEAAKGLTALYAEQAPAAYEKQQEVFAKIKAEFVPEQEYIRSVYIYALQAKCLSALKQNVINIPQLETDINEFVSLAKTTPAQTDDYTAAELKMRLVLLEEKYAGQNAEEQRTAMRDNLQNVLAEFSILTDPRNDTEKLLADLASVNLNVLELALPYRLQITPNPRGAETTVEKYLALYERLSDPQKNLLIGILLRLAGLTENTVISEHGDDDLAEQALEVLLGLSDPPKGISFKPLSAVLDADYLKILEPRLRLDYAWSLLKEERPDKAKLNAAIGIAAAIYDWAKNVGDAQTQLEAKSLQMLAKIKSGEENETRAAAQWYKDQLADPQCPIKIFNTAVEILPSVYAYALNDYGEALAFIRTRIQSDLETSETNLDPENFAIIADCWTEENRSIPENLAAAYLNYAPKNEEEKIALANIFTKYIEQRMPENKTKLSAEENQYLAKVEEYMITLADTALAASADAMLDKIIVIRAREAVSAKDYAAAEEKLAPLGAKLEKLKEAKMLSEAASYVFNDACRLLAQVKEAQGYYEQALAELAKTDNGFIKAPAKKDSAERYDGLQRVGLYSKLGRLDDAEKLLQELVSQPLPLDPPADWTAEQKDLYYLRRIAIAEERNDPADKEILENYAYAANLTPANHCRAQLALLDPRAKAADNLRKVADILTALPASERQNYEQLITQLESYVALEKRDFDDINAWQNREFPSLDTQNGLEQIDSALIRHYIYLSIQEGDAALEQIEENIGKAQTVLTQNKNEGLGALLRNYIARLQLLKYKFLSRHYAANDLQDKRDAAKAQFETALAALPAKQADQLREEYERLNKERSASQDRPAYNILEQEFDQTLSGISNGLTENNDFWESKALLDNLLNDAVAVRHLFAPAAVILAVSELYGLDDLPARFSQDAADFSQIDNDLLAAVRKMPDGPPLTSAEKGYGYLLLLRFLDDQDEYAELRKIISEERYDSSDRTYYHESSALIITYLRDNKNEKELPAVKYSSQGESVQADLARIGEAQGRRSLSEAIAAAEKLFMQALGLADRSELYDGPDGALGRYLLGKSEVNIATPGQSKHTMEKAFLELLALLVRQRAEGTLNRDTDRRIISLLNIAKEYEPVGGYFYELKYQLALLQYNAALSSVTEYQGYGPAQLPQALGKTIPVLLRQRAKGALAAADEKALATTIADALAWSTPSTKPSIKEKYVLPDEAFYLYSELISGLAKAAITAANTKPGRADCSLYLERARILQDILKKVDPAHDSLDDISKDTAAAGRLITITPQYNFFRERKADSYAYSWSEDSLDLESPNRPGQEHNVAVQRSEEIETQEGLVAISTDLLKNYGLFPSLTLGTGVVKHTSSDTLTDTAEEGSQNYTQEYKTLSFTAGLGASWQPAFLQNKLFGENFLVRNSELGFNVNGRLDWSRLSPLEQNQWREKANISAEEAQTLFPEISAWYEFYTGGLLSLRGLENIALGLRESAALSTYNFMQAGGFSIEGRDTKSFVNKLTVAPQFSAGRFAARLVMDWLYRKNLTDAAAAGENIFPAELALNYYGANNAFGLSAGLDNVQKPDILKIGASWQSSWFNYGTFNLNVPISIQEGKIKGINAGFSFWF